MATPKGFNNRNRLAGIPSHKISGNLRSLTTAAGGDAAGANLRPASYTNNLLNQIIGRDVPGYANVLGRAHSNATVSLWSPESTSQYARTTRKGEYFRGELPVNNSSAAKWMTITNLAALNDGNNPDIVTNTVGSTFVPKTAEMFYYDYDGSPREISGVARPAFCRGFRWDHFDMNTGQLSHGEIPTNDGRWTYTWDLAHEITALRRPPNSHAHSGQSLHCAQLRNISRAEENRLVRMVANTAVGPQQRIEFEYDAKSRRIGKKVWNNTAGTGSPAVEQKFVHPVRYEGSILLRLRAVQRRRPAALCRLYARSARAVPPASGWGGSVHSRTATPAFDLLRGQSEPGGRAQAGEVFEDGLGQALSKEPFEELSHGVNDGWNLLAVLSASSQLQSAYVWGMDLSGSEQGLPHESIVQNFLSIRLVASIASMRDGAELSLSRGEGGLPRFDWSQ